MTSIIGYLDSREPSKEKGEVVLDIITIGNTTREIFNFTGSIRDLLNLNHSVSGEYRIKCIDGVCESSKYSWKIYVNERLISKSSYVYTVGDGDKVQVSLI